MSWKQHLAWPIHSVREALGAYPYTHAQTYTFTYSLSIQSLDDTPLQPLTLAIPLPTDTAAQKLKDFVLHLPNTHELHDPLFGNHLLIATIQPLAASVELPVFRCLIDVHPDHGQTATPQALQTPNTDNPFLHSTDPRIQILAKNIGQGSSVRQTAKRINRYLIKHLTYGDPIDQLYSDLEALTQPHVDCGGFDTLFVSLCLANNIPARVVSGFWLDKALNEPNTTLQRNDMHAWAEFQTEKGQWVPVDPSVEQLARQGRTYKSGRFGFVGADRVRLSQGCHIPIEINNTIFHAPILQHPTILSESSQTLVRAHVRLD